MKSDTNHKPATSRTFSFPQPTLPGRVKFGGYVYILEFTDGLVKVGMSSEPRTRVSALTAAAKVFGQDALRGWLSPHHEQPTRSEARLIAAATALGGQSRAVEYFTGVSFPALVRLANRFPFHPVDTKAHLDEQERLEREWVVARYGSLEAKAAHDGMANLARRLAGPRVGLGSPYGRQATARAVEGVGFLLASGVGEVCAPRLVFADLVADRRDAVLTSVRLRDLAWGMDDGIRIYCRPNKDGRLIRAIGGTVLGTAVLVRADAFDIAWITATPPDWASVEDIEWLDSAVSR